MHYIRFLKPPRLGHVSDSSGANVLEIKTKVTVTTDLGESFLLADVELEAALHTATASNEESHETVLGTYNWRSGMRSVEISALLPAPRVARRLHEDGKKRKLSRPSSQVSWPCALVVRPKNSELCIDTAEKVLAEKNAGIVPAWSEELTGSVDHRPSPRVLRRLTLNDSTNIRIWEETGESIERHVWDAGLLLSSYLSQQPGGPRSMPLLSATLLRPSLEVLELGAGCGIVGITLGKVSGASVVLSDLPSAAEIMDANVRSNARDDIEFGRRITTQNLDWEAPLATAVAGKVWDLILVADCTYNADVVPDLVHTLRRLTLPAANNDRECLILLAMKVRHDSEKIFFELMSDAGFQIREHVKVPLGILGEDEDAEEIEIYAFAAG